MVYEKYSNMYEIFQVCFFPFIYNYFPSETDNRQHYRVKRMRLLSFHDKHLIKDDINSQ